MATALKKQFEKTAAYKRFTTLINQGALRLRQTELAFLIPPKLCSKGRFQSNRSPTLLNIFTKKS
jgi:hypothetical protein